MHDFFQRFYCLRVGSDPIICLFVSLDQAIPQADTPFRYVQFILEVFYGLLHSAFIVPFSLRLFRGRGWCRLVRGIFCSICRLCVGGVWGYAAIHPHHYAPGHHQPSSREMPLLPQQNLTAVLSSVEVIRTVPHGTSVQVHFLPFIFHRRVGVGGYARAGLRRLCRVHLQPVSEILQLRL